MNPKSPNKDLETKIKKRWLDKNKEELDPWRGVTDLLAQIDPVNLPKDYDFKALHEKVMSAVNDSSPPWLLEKEEKKRS